MSTTRFRCDHLLTMAEEPTVVTDGVVDVVDGRVGWAGAHGDAPAHDGPVEWLTGLVMPGFVNAHAHTPMVLLRGAGEGLPVDRWLIEVMWPREGRLTSDDVWWGMTLGASELIGNGVTTSHEMYFYGGSVAEAMEAAGLRGVVTPPLLTGEALGRFGSWQDQLDVIAGLADRYADHDLISIGVGPHSAYALPEEPLRAVAALAQDRGLHIHIHVAEAEHEGDGVMKEHGLTVPAYLYRLGMLESRVVAAHGVWLTGSDIDLFADRLVGVAHCPISNGKHASGLAPVADMRAAGIPVGLATDGPSSHDRLDPFEEMRAAIRCARLRSGNAAAMTPADTLAMATRGAAAVLGRDDLGTLQPGSRADMILVDTAPLVPVDEPEDLVTHLVYSGAPHLVRSAWVGGRAVMADRQLTTVDVVEARIQATERARRLAEAT